MEGFEYVAEQKHDAASQNLWNKQIEPFDVVKRRMEKLNYMLKETFYEGTTDSCENVEVKERLMCQLSHHLFHSFCLFFLMLGCFIARTGSFKPAKRANINHYYLSKRWVRI